MSATGEMNGGSSETLTGGGVGDSAGAGVPESYVGGQIGGRETALIKFVWHILSGIISID